jgi:hypothetical protein
MAAVAAAAAAVAAAAVVFMTMTKAMNHNSEFLHSEPCHLRTTTPHNSLTSPILSSLQDDAGILIF